MKALVVSSFNCVNFQVFLASWIKIVWTLTLKRKSINANRDKLSMKR